MSIVFNFCPCTHEHLKSIFEYKRTRTMVGKRLSYTLPAIPFKSPCVFSEGLYEGREQRLRAVRKGLSAIRPKPSSAPNI